MWRHAIIDRAGAILWVNDEASAARLVGVKIWTALPDSHSDKLRDAVAHAFLDGLPRQLSGMYRKRAYQGSIVKLDHAAAIASWNTSPIPLLTKREIEFLTLVCGDLRHYEIAERMRVASATVDRYRQILRQKLKVNGTAGLVLSAIRAGLCRP